MILTLTINPALDYVMDVEDMALSKINRSRKENVYPGGKGINVSQVLSNLGENSYAMYFAGGFTGIKLKELLDEKNINSQVIFLDNQMTRINVKVRSKTETAINANGMDLKKEHIDKLLENIKLLKKEDYLVLSGNIPSSLSDELYKNIIENLKSKDIKVIVDASGYQLTKTLALKPFLIKPNDEEVGEIFGVKIENFDDAFKYAQKLQEMGARNVLVSMGKKGAILLTEDLKEYESLAIRGELKNSVGAGDSMVAGFIYGYRKYEDYKKAFQYALASGSATAFSDQLAIKEEIINLLEKAVISGRKK